MKHYIKAIMGGLAGTIVMDINDVFCGPGNDWTENGYRRKSWERCSVIAG